VAGFSLSDLAAIDSADELQISSRRANGTMRPYVTIWGVREGNDVYVRSAYGAQNGWFRRAILSGRGRIRTGGVERDVLFDRSIDAATHARIDAAYHRKYDRYGARVVGTVVGPSVRDVTLRLLAL